MTPEPEPESAALSAADLEGLLDEITAWPGGDAGPGVGIRRPGPRRRRADGFQRRRSLSRGMAAPGASR